MANNRFREIGSSELALLATGDKPVLVDFYATWCGPCKAMEPFIERLAQRFAGRADVVKVNIDNSPDLAAEYGIRGVPTFLLFAKRRAAARVSGLSSEGSLAALIEEQIGNRQAGEQAA
jgi:thioredoxin